MSLVLVSTLFSLNALANTADQRFIISVSSSAEGSVSPGTTQFVSNGNDVKFTATPNTNFMVTEWKVDGQIAQEGGIEFTLKNIAANHNVTVSFAVQNILYAAGANSYLYYTMDNGLHWHTTPNRPDVNNAIDEVFATNSAVYVVNTGKFVFYSLDNGTTWNSTTFSPDYGKISSIYVTPSNTIFIGTHKGNIFFSNNTGASWTAISNPPSSGNRINSLFVKNNAIYLGSSDGKVYYSADRNTWTAINGAPDGSAIRYVFVTNDLLYVSTANQYVYTSPNLTGGGTWTPFAQSVYSLFVNGDGSIVNAATQNGFVYSLNTSESLGLISYTPLNSIFFLG